jgi:hypothetical protein
VYDLATDGAGEARFIVDYRILKIQGEAGTMSKVFDIGMNVASAFFPYYTFLARAGLFGLNILTTSGNEGLDILVEEHTEQALGRTTSRIFTLDPRSYDKGIYQFYVTVKDTLNGSISTQSIRFAITD